MSKATTSSQGSHSRVTAAGGLLAAVLASSCCIVPLLLVTLGVSGAWIGNLSAMEAYKPFFVLITFVFLAIGFWQIYINPQRACSDGEVCARPFSDRLVKSVLWVATLLVLLAISVDFWAPLFY